MNINKIKSLLLLLIGIAIYSCSDKASKLEGVYVREEPTKNPDSIFITHLKDKHYTIEVRQWKDGQKKFKSTTGTLDKDQIYFENGNSVQVIENNTILAGRVKYLKIE
ncbi:hypothetical protein [Leeuwenhoekiella marinoflava]|uniref:hypothetical protein n=1 Tax=Leeuwenhoekiella marinoflava TaxID=988 RepID=UPI003002B99A